MITIQEKDNLISVAVFGEFTLADYKEFEAHVLHEPRPGGKVNVLFDFHDMAGYTVDVAWEDIKFVRKHGSTFNKVAIVTENQWQAWTAWIANLFVDANIRVFEDHAEAKLWAEI